MSPVNPWLVIALMVAFAVGCWRAYEFGKETEGNRVAAEANRERATLIQTHNANAVIDMGAAAEAEAARQTARRKSLESRHALELDIERGNRAAAELAAAHPDCPAPARGLDDASFRLLVESIRAANGPAAAGTGIMPRGLPARPGATGRPGRDDPAVAGRPDRSAPGVPPVAR